MTLGLLIVVMQTNWRLALVSLTVLPVVLIPTARIGRRIRSTSRHTQEHVGRIKPDSTGNHLRAYRGPCLRRRAVRDATGFAAARTPFTENNLRYVLQQALASPLIEVCGALTIVALLLYARSEIKTGELTAGKFMGFIVAPADAV